MFLINREPPMRAGLVPLKARVAFFSLAEFVYIVFVSWYENRPGHRPPAAGQGHAAEGQLPAQHGAAADGKPAPLLPQPAAEREAAGSSRD